MRIEPQDYHALASSTPSIAEDVGQARRESHRRPRRPAGPRRRARTPARDRARPPLGRGLRRAAPLPRPEPDHLQVAAAGRPRGSRAVVGRLAGRRRLPRPPDRQREDRGAAAAAPSRRTARGPDRAGGRGVRHRDRRSRSRRVGSGRVRRVGGPRDDRDRARGAGRPGGHVVPDRELPRLPIRRVR